MIVLVEYFLGTENFKKICTRKSNTH